MADKKSGKSGKSGVPVPYEEAEYVEAEPIEPERHVPTYRAFAEYAWHMMAHAPMPIDKTPEWFIRKLKGGKDGKGERGKE